MSIALQIQNIAQHHTKTLFSQVNLHAISPTKIGLIGDNGIGKSTLLKIISGAETSDEGKLVWIGDPHIAYLPQELIGNEYQVSGGQQKILKLTEIFYGGYDAILLDEPDNHLDLEHREWFSELVSEFSGLVIVISHDRYFLRNFVDKIWLVEDQKVQSYDGPYEKFWQTYTQEKETQTHLFHVQEREQQRLKDYIARMKTWVKLNDKFAGRYRSALKRYDRFINNMTTKPQSKKQIKLSTTDIIHPNSKTALHLEHISKSFDNFEILNDINLHLFIGDKIAISAPNGSGKTTLLSIISGSLPYDFGRFRIGSNLKLGVYTQDHNSALNDNLSPIDTLRNNLPISEPQAVTHLAKFLFTYDQMRSPIKFLSGGQKSRLQLASLLATNPDILILDEPTNHLDLTTVQLLEDYLRNFPGSIVLVSHDQESVDNVVETIYVLNNGQLTKLIN